MNSLLSPSLLAPFCGALLAVAASVGAQVNYNKANDYYQALPTGGVQVVEQYHLGPADTHLRARRYPQAYSDTVFILNIFPNHPKALVLMVQICEQWKSPQCRLEDFFEKAIAINPNAAGTYTAQGIYLHRSRRYPQAIDSFKRALELDADSLNAQYNLGLTYVETKQYELANQHAQRAYALGAPVPGLRRKLEQLGHWKAIAAPQAPAAAAPAQEPAAPAKQ